MSDPNRRAPHSPPSSPGSSNMPPNLQAALADYQTFLKDRAENINQDASQQKEPQQANQQTKPEQTRNGSDSGSKSSGSSSG